VYGSPISRHSDEPPALPALAGVAGGSGQAHRHDLAQRKYVDIIIAAKDRMVRVGDWKLTYQPLTDGATYRLFNIREDPDACATS
jgi:hypothetical protein